MLSRREFLKLLGVAGAGALLGPTLAGCRQMVQQSPSPAYRVTAWTGDSLGPMHRIRDWERMKKMPAIPEPSKKVDLVIVGGGLAGLALAYYCRNEHFLLLERETELGGNAKSGEYNGLKYAKGSAYLVDIGEPYGGLYEALGLDLKPVPKPDNQYFNGKRWESFEDIKIRDELHTGFEKLRKHLSAKLLKPDFPGLPIQQATPDMLRLDNASFYDYLKSDYPPALLKYVDAYCQSALGGSIQQISAYAGVNFYSEIAGDIVAFPGGNAEVVQKITSILRAGEGASRFETGVSVFSVKDHGDHVRVTYFDNKTHEMTTVAAKRVVMATPYVITARMLQGVLPQQQQVLRACRYGSYLVANACFDTVPEGMGDGAGYDHWLLPEQQPAQGHHATDFIVADWTRKKRATAGAHAPFVISMYGPFAQPSLGRARMLSEKPDKLAGEMATALQQVLRFNPKTLKEMRLTRYGHQLLRSETGLIRRLAQLPRQFGNIHLCHSDGQGMASIESAIMEAHRTAALLFA